MIGDKMKFPHNGRYKATKPKVTAAQRKAKRLAVKAARKRNR